MNYRERDKKHLWHPLTQHGLDPDHLPIVRSAGSCLYDETGKAYIDGIASWYTCMYGHCNPQITARVKQQLDQLDQVVFSGFTHPPAIELSEKLVSILPDGLAKIFFSDNGSTSVDVAIKMALQFHFNRGARKNQIIALDNAFHGDTFGAMSVSGLSVYNGPFEEFLLEVKRIPVPDKTNIGEVKKTLEAYLKSGEVAAFIFEPLVQGAAAMHMYEARHLDQLMHLSSEYGALNIADEVMTGFGKTGKNFASEYLRSSPDIICLSKSLTAGVAPMALTCCTEEVFEAFYGQEISRGFFHGHTYSANPLSCAAAIAGIDLLQSDEIQLAIERINQRHSSFDERIKDHPMVERTRLLGVIFALDLKAETERYGNLRDRLYRFFLEQGVFLRPLGNTIYLLPPFTISDEELSRIYESVLKCLEMLSHEG
jgi:adenosylmethionine-8-amino-7-oxononanoate aminotransferase